MADEREQWVHFFIDRVWRTRSKNETGKPEEVKKAFVVLMFWVIGIFFCAVSQKEAWAIEEQFFGEAAPTLGTTGTVDRDLGTGYGFGWTIGDWVLPDFKLRGGVQWILFPGASVNSNSSLEAIPVTFGMEYVPPGLGSAQKRFYGYGVLDAGIFPAIQTNQTFSSVNPYIDFGIGGNLPVSGGLAVFLEVKCALVINTFYRSLPQTNGQTFFYIPVQFGFLF